MNSNAFEGKSLKSSGAGSGGSDGEEARAKHKGVMGWLRKSSSRMSRHGAQRLNSCQVESLDVEERQCKQVQSTRKERGLACKSSGAHLCNRSLAEMFNSAATVGLLRERHDIKKSFSLASRASSEVSDTEYIKRTQSATSMKSEPTSEVERDCHSTNVASSNGVAPESPVSFEVQECADPETPEFSPSSWLLKFQLQEGADSQIITFYQTSVRRITDHLDELESKAMCLLSEVDSVAGENVDKKTPNCAVESDVACTSNTPAQIRMVMDRDDELYNKLATASSQRLSLHSLLWKIKYVRKVLLDSTTDAKVEAAIAHDLEGERAQLESWQNQWSTLRRTEHSLKQLYHAVCASRSDSLHRYHGECKRLNQSIQLLRDKIVNVIDDLFSCFEKSPSLERMYSTSSNSSSQGRSKLRNLRSQIPGFISELKLYSFDPPNPSIGPYTPDIGASGNDAPASSSLDKAYTPVSVGDALPRSVCVRSVPPGLALACSKADIQRYEKLLWNSSSGDGSSVQGKWGSFRIFEQWLADAMKWQLRDAFMYTELRERGCNVEEMVRCKKLDVKQALKLRLKQLWLGRSVEMRAFHSSDAQQRLLGRLFSQMPNETITTAHCSIVSGCLYSQKHQYVDNREEVENALMYVEDIRSRVGRVIATPAYQTYTQVLDTLYPKHANFSTGDISAVSYLKKQGERIRETLKRLDDLEDDDTGSLIVEKECCQLEAATALLMQELLSIESRRSLRESQLFEKRDRLKRDLEKLGAAFDLENLKLKSIEVQWEKLDGLEELIRGCIPPAEEIAALRLKVEMDRKELEGERAVLSEERKKLEAIKEMSCVSPSRSGMKKEKTSDGELYQGRRLGGYLSEGHDPRRTASNYSEKSASENVIVDREASDVSGGSASPTVRHKGIMERLFKTSNGRRRVNDDSPDLTHAASQCIATSGERHEVRQWVSDMEANGDGLSTPPSLPSIERQNSEHDSAFKGTENNCPAGGDTGETPGARCVAENKTVDETVPLVSLASKVYGTVSSGIAEVLVQESGPSVSYPSDQTTGCTCEPKPDRSDPLKTSRSAMWAPQTSILESLPNIFEEIEISELQAVPRSDEPCVSQVDVAADNLKFESESCASDSQKKHCISKRSTPSNSVKSLDSRQHSCTLEATPMYFSGKLDNERVRDSVDGSLSPSERSMSRRDLNGKGVTGNEGDCSEEILPLIPFPSETLEPLKIPRRKSFSSEESTEVRGNNHMQETTYQKTQLTSAGTSLARSREHHDSRMDQVSNFSGRLLVEHGLSAFSYVEEDDRIELFLTNGKADLTAAVFSSPIFSLLDSDDKQHCIHVMQSSIVQIPKGCTLLQRGEKVDTLYFLVSGRLGQSLSVYARGEHKLIGPIDYTGRRRSSVGTDTNPDDYPIVLESGAFVTPRAFVREGQTAHSIVALQASTLQKLSFHSFQQVISGCIFRKAPQVSSIFSSCPILDSLTRREKAQVVALMKWRIYLPDEVIWHQGEMCRELILIMKGHARALRVVERSGTPEVVEEYSAGDSINSLALLHDVPASVSVVATSPEGCVVASLDRNDMQDNIGDVERILNRRFERSEEQGKERALKHVGLHVSSAPSIMTGVPQTMYWSRVVLVDGCTMRVSDQETALQHVEKGLALRLVHAEPLKCIYRMQRPVGLNMRVPEGPMNDFAGAPLATNTSITLS